MGLAERAKIVLHSEGIEGLLRRSGGKINREVREAIRENRQFVYPYRVTDHRQIRTKDGESNVWERDPEKIEVNRTDTDEKDIFGRIPTNDRESTNFVIKVDECRIIDETAVALLDGGEILLDSVGGNRDYFFYRMDDYLPTSKYELLRRQIYRREPGDIDYLQNEPVFPMTPPYDNFYAWVIEYLPKLRMLDVYERETGHEPAILIKSTSPDFVPQSLAYLGYGPRLERWSGGEARVKNLLIAKHRLNTSEAARRYGYDLSYDYLNFLRKRVRRRPRQSHPDADRIYISRQNAGRNVANFDELRPILHDHGFTIVCLEELPFENQVELVADASVVMGPHGAGLAHLIFGEDLTVIEMFNRLHIKPTYYVLSEAFGHEYHSTINDVDGGDIRIDTVEIETLLQSALA